MTDCSNCGRTRDLHLVTAPYDESLFEHEIGAGRILVYCISCVNERWEKLYLNIPLNFVTSDTLASLYKNGYTDSDPDTFVFSILGASEQNFELNDITHDSSEYLVRTLKSHNGTVRRT